MFSESKAALFIVTSMFGSFQSVDVTTNTIDFYDVAKCQTAAKILNGQKYTAVEGAARGVSSVLITAVCLEK